MPVICLRKHTAHKSKIHIPFHPGGRVSYRPKELAHLALILRCHLAAAEAAGGSKGVTTISWNFFSLSELRCPHFSMLRAKQQEARALSDLRCGHQEGHARSTTPLATQPGLIWVSPTFLFLCEMMLGVLMPRICTSSSGECGHFKVLWFSRAVRASANTRAAAGVPC